MKRSSLYVAAVSLAVDVIALLAGLVVAYQLRAGGEELYFWPFSAYLRFALMFVPVWVVVFASQGLYNARILPRGWNALGRVLIGLLAGWGMLLIVLYLWRSPQALVFPRLVIIYGILATTGFVLTGKFILASIVEALNASGIGVVRTVILGNHTNKALVDSFQLEERRGRRLVDQINGGDYLKKLRELLKKEKFDEIIINADLEDEELLEIVEWAQQRAINVAAIPTLLSVRATHIEMTTVAGSPVMYFLRTPLIGWRRVYKRLFDLLLVIPALLILSPLFIIIAILVRLSSPGSAIFKQARVGQDGCTIYVHKFRSMYVDGDKKHKDMAGWSGDEATDPRITTIGRILRRTNLDELPQLWDIFVGRMSIVGPRPEQPKYVEKFAGEIPGYLKRHHVKTGLTGWAQINGLRGDTSISERVKYDLYYIENWSIWFDIRIIISTFLQTFRQITNFK